MRIISNETREKMRLAHVGKKHSAETLEKMRISHLGKIPSNKGEKRLNPPWNKGLKWSEEVKEKLRISHLGKKLTEEQKKKLSIANTGKTMSAEARKKISNALRRRKEILGYIHSPETRKKISEAKKGSKMSIETRRKMSEAKKNSKYIYKGHPISPETRKKMIIGIKERNSGSKHRWWKGGISSLTNKLQESIEYNQWRKSIFERDNYTCQHCGIRGGKIEAHHKKQFRILRNEAKAKSPLLEDFEACMLYEPLWDINNGITFCKKCHTKTKNYGIRGWTVDSSD